MSEQLGRSGGPKPSLDRSALRGVLRAVLLSDSDVEAFCLDHFPAVQARFSGGMERTHKENLLLRQISSATLSRKLWELYPEAMQRAVEAHASNRQSAAEASSESSPGLRRIVWIALLVSGVAALAGALVLTQRGREAPPTLLHSAAPPDLARSDGLGPAPTLPVDQAKSATLDKTDKTANLAARGKPRVQPHAPIPTEPAVEPPTLIVHFTVNAQVGDTVVLIRDSDKKIIEQRLVKVSQQEYAGGQLFGIPKQVFDTKVYPGSYTLECLRGNKIMQRSINITPQQRNNDVEISCK